MTQLIETSAGGIVFKKENNQIYWLIIKHAGKGHWGFPKGHVADKIANEQLEEAALREVLEEGGIKAKIVNEKPIMNEYYYSINKKPRKKHVYYFLMDYVSGNIKDHDHEISDIKWATEKEVYEIVTYKTERDLFQKMLQLFSSVH